MTVVVEPSAAGPASAESETHAHPITGPLRWLAAAVLVLGGGLQFAEFALEPQQADNGARVAWWLHHSTQLELSQAAGVLAVVFLIFGAAIMWRLTRDDSRRIAAAAGVLVVSAMVGLGAIHGVEMAAHWAAQASGARAALTILDVGQLGISGVVTFAMFLPAAVLGNLLMAVALWRSRYVPRLLALLVVAFVVLDFVIDQGLVSHATTLVEGGLLGWAVVIGYRRSSGRNLLRRAH